MAHTNKAGASGMMKKKPVSKEPIAPVVAVGDNRQVLMYNQQPPLDLSPDLAANHLNAPIPIERGGSPVAAVAVPVAEMPLVAWPDDVINPRAGKDESILNQQLTDNKAPQVFAQPVIVQSVVDQPPLPNGGQAVDKPSTEPSIATRVPDPPPPPNPPVVRKTLPMLDIAPRESLSLSVPGNAPTTVAPNAPNAGASTGSLGPAPLASNGAPLVAPGGGSNRVLYIVVGVVVVTVIAAALFLRHAGGAE